MATPPAIPTLDDGTDLGAARAARHKKRGGRPTFILDEGLTVSAPAGLPLTAFAPLMDLNIDMALLWATAQQARREGGDEAMANMVINFFVGNPDLPRDFIRVLGQVGRNLFGDEGFDALMAWGPEIEDLQAIARTLIERWGVSLGEASGSSPSSTSTGEPSTPISAAGTPSTSPTSGPTQETEGGSPDGTSST